MVVVPIGAAAKEHGPHLPLKTDYSTSGLDYSQTGARGDPTLATAEKGKAALDGMARELVDGIRALFHDANQAT